MNGSAQINPDVGSDNATETDKTGENGSKVEEILHRQGEKVPQPLQIQKMTNRQRVGGPVAVGTEATGSYITAFSSGDWLSCLRNAKEQGRLSPA